MRLIEVCDHGILPNGEGNSERLEALLSNSPDGATLRFQPGKYRFNKSVNIQNACDMTLKGENTEFIFSGMISGLCFKGCQNMEISGITIDWDRPPFSVGSILENDGQRFVVRVFDDYPVCGDEPIEAFLEFEPHTGIPRYNGNDIYWDTQEVTLLEDQTLEVVFKGKHEVAPKGTLVVMRHNIYDLNSIEVEECTGFNIHDTNIYASPGMGLMAKNSEDFALERLNIRVKPGSNRLISSNSDGLHFMNCAGDITIENCLFEGMGDDALNVHGFYMDVVSMVDEKTIIVANRRGYNLLPRSGDTMEVSKADTLIPFEELVIDLCGYCEEGIKIVFCEKLPQGVMLGDLVANATRCAKLHVSNTTVRNKRCRGFLIETRDVLVENCTFENISGGAILVFTENMDFTEAIGTRNIRIKHNRLRNNNFGLGRMDADITVTAFYDDYKLAPVGVHKDIVIEGNTIEDTCNGAIFIGSTEGASIVDNTIKNSCMEPSKAEIKACIRIVNSAHVDLGGNRIEEHEDGEVQGLSLVDSYAVSGDVELLKAH